jgi:hypothetical protein
MDNLHKLLEKTLLKLEYEALDKDKFWLEVIFNFGKFFNEKLTSIKAYVFTQSTRLGN